MRAMLRLAILIAVWGAAAAPALAQQRGSISGKVIDPGGLALPGATVTVTEQDTGFSRTVVTATTGAYTVPNLDPGSYVIVVEMSGFAPLKRPDVRLTAGATAVLDLQMQMAGVAEEVVVTGQAPLIDGGIVYR